MNTLDFKKSLKMPSARWYPMDAAIWEMNFVVSIEVGATCFTCQLFPFGIYSTSVHMCATA